MLHKGTTQPAITILNKENQRRMYGQIENLSMTDFHPQYGDSIVNVVKLDLLDAIPVTQ